MTPPRTCLIVDDESSVRAYVKSILEREHFRTFEAPDGLRGLRMVENLGDALDVIVGDVQMPGGDGMTFVCAARELFPALPIVLISGYPEPERHKRLSTPFEFIQKPFLPDALLTAVENATKKMELRRKTPASESGSRASQHRGPKDLAG
jgi:two-component system cell cycle sensor histidine kinase/response regulator CckA